MLIIEYYYSTEMNIHSTEENMLVRFDRVCYHQNKEDSTMANRIEKEED